MIIRYGHPLAYKIKSSISSITLQQFSTIAFTDETLVNGKYAHLCYCGHCCVEFRGTCCLCYGAGACAVCRKRFGS